MPLPPTVGIENEESSSSDDEDDDEDGDEDDEGEEEEDRPTRRKERHSSNPSVPLGWPKVGIMCLYSIVTTVSMKRAIMQSYLLSLDGSWVFGHCMCTYVIINQSLISLPLFPLGQGYCDSTVSNSVCLPSPSVAPPHGGTGSFPPRCKRPIFL